MNLVNRSSPCPCFRYYPVRTKHQNGKYSSSTVVLLDWIHRCSFPVHLDFYLGTEDTFAEKNKTLELLRWLTFSNRFLRHKDEWSRGTVRLVR